ncbi:MAG: hypothetical protein NC483_05900 [Ruminococcus sp.]|nr:hypothetical protein [Ruminococcus sp.]
MKIEKLRNKNSKRYFLCGLIMVVVLTITVTFIGSKANYRMSASIPLTEGKVTANPYDINVVALYLDNVEQPKDTPIPISGYIINENDSFCCKGSNCKKEDKDTNVTLRTFAGLHIFRGISKRDKCFLYFDKIDSSNAVTMSNLLENYYTDKRVRTSENKDFNIPFEDATIKTIFTAQDDDGTSYYFAGNPLDNWVEFGGYYWRIIRVNGDGSIRMIYQGTEPNEKGIETQIGIGSFNNLRDNNRYVGFLYGNDGELRGLTNKSTIYELLTNWFETSNINKNSKYFDKLNLDAGFCGDRTPYNGSNPDTATISGGTGTILTRYGSLVRLRPSDKDVTKDTQPVMPTFSCTNNNDLYTYTNSNKGNKALENPVGLITADEASYAGMISDYNNTSRTVANYLCTEQSYWTISPSAYPYADVYQITSNGAIDGYFSVNYSRGIRPVINLRSDATFTGNGTISNPYKVIV